MTLVGKCRNHPPRQSGVRAHTLYKRDVEYVVKEGEVIIVDEFTGRLMPGRRWSDGLHQAVEAKEGLRIQQENQTLATITFQNYFRMYKKLSGMTGTAETEAEEFAQDLQARCHGHSRRIEPMRRIENSRHDLSHRAREVRRGRQGNQTVPRTRASPFWSARSRSTGRKSSARC